MLDKNDMMYEDPYQENLANREERIKVSFNATCLATYRTSLLVPKHIVDTNDNEYLAKYLSEHIDETKVEDDLDWIRDTEEPVTSNDIVCIGGAYLV